MKTICAIAIVVLCAATFHSGSSASSSIRVFHTKAPALVSNLHLSSAASLSVLMDGESVSTFSDDCETPNSSFNLGQTVCVKVTGAPPGPPFLRRLTWVNPSNLGERSIEITSDPQTDSFTLPATTTSVIGGQVVDNRGKWRVIVTSIVDGTLLAEATITVRDQSAAAADLAVYKFGPVEVSPGSNISYGVLVVNNGPDTAQAVEISDAIPANTTFVSGGQDSGPAFSCSNPPAGESSGTTTCTIGSLASGDTAQFTFVYHVEPGTPDGTLILSVATVSSSTSEINSADNSGQAVTTVRSGAPQECSIACPSNIITDNQNAPNPCSVVVSYSTPTTSGTCADPETGQTPSVLCSPPSNSSYPVGTTIVTCSSGGNACSFTVTVQETRPPTPPVVICPGDVNANEEFPGAGSASVSYSTPTATGNCVTVVCDPPSGSRFSVGTTTISCIATDSTNNTATCSFTVTVTSGDCAIICPSDVTQSAGANQCAAVVNYPTPTTTGTCGPLTCTPPSGSTFPVGTATVTCSVSGGPSCDFAVTVLAPAPPTITTCATNKTVAVNALCEATIPNLAIEVVATGCSVTISQSPAAGTIVGPGVVSVTITAENSVGEATCAVNVVVADATPPVIAACPVGTSADASGCQAAVPDVTGSVTATDNCTLAGSLSITQSPSPGTFVGIGTTTITITVKDEANNSSTCTTTFTVNGPQLTALGPARVWVGLKNSDDVGTKFDLLAEVFRNGVLVGSGQVNNVAGGSSGFNNAILHTINLALPSPGGLCVGDTFSFKLSVRVAAASGHTSGTARLWFNDAAANSRFSATAGGVASDYFLRDGFLLNTTAGPGPKKTIDVLVNRNVGGNPFKPFGTWVKTL